MACAASCSDGDRPESLATVEQPLSAGLVISQVYGGAGNTTPTYSSDYIELFNRGTTSVSIAGWSLQYASAATGWAWGAAVNLPGATIPPGGYYLVKLLTPTPLDGAILPTADTSGTTSVSIVAGKVALVASTVLLTCSTGCATVTNVRDLVGYGTSTDFEGSGAAPANSATTATLRKNGGCTETDNNASDFAAGAPTPRNSSTIAPCGVDAGVDTGPPDTGAPDTRPPDTGTPDTGTPDTGTPDTGTPDTEAADSADGAIVDIGSDATVKDLGTADGSGDTAADAIEASADSAVDDTSAAEDVLVAEDATVDATEDLGVDAERPELDLPAGEPTCSCRTPSGPTSSARDVVGAALVALAAAWRHSKRARRA